MMKEVANKRDSGDIFVKVFSKKLYDFFEDVKQIDIVQFVGILFIIYASTSYFGLPMFDSQPFPVMLAFLFIGLRVFERNGNVKIPLLFISLGLLLACGIVLGTYFGFSVNMLWIRGVVNYSSIIIFLIAFYDYIKHYGFPIKILVAVNILWILVGIIQLILPDIVSLFVASRTNPGRGVTSLGPEPSSFGFYLLFISWIYLLVTDYNPPKWIKVMIAVNIMSILFLAVSAVTLVMLFVSIIFYVTVNIRKFTNFRNFVLLTATIIVVYFLIMEVMKGSRMELLFFQLLNVDFMTLIKADESVRSRLLHVFLPIYILIMHAGFPLGLQSFQTKANEILSKWDDIYMINIADDKIMSWNATFFYEIGLFGVLIWILIYIFLHNGTIRRVAEITLLFILLFASIPLSYPLIPLIFVIMYMTNSRHNRLKEKLIRV